MNAEKFEQDWGLISRLWELSCFSQTSSPFCPGYVGEGVFSVNYLPGLTQTVILLISTPQVARIISMTQQYLVSTENLLEFHHRRVFLVLKIPLNSKQKNCKMCNIKTLQGYLNLKYFFYGFSFTSYNQWKQK
jgi:hypothetical protein